MLKSYPLELNVSLSGWRLYNMRLQDPRFKPIFEKVEARQLEQCIYCGFCADSHMSVVNLNQNYRDNKLENMALSCPFCAQCGFLESIGVSGFGGAVLIYLPQVSQSELNLLCHALFSQMILGGQHADAAKNKYRDLRLKTKAVEDCYGEGMSKPHRLGQLLLDAPIMRGHNDKVREYLKDLRLLPTYTRYILELMDGAAQSIDFWRLDR